MVSKRTVLRCWPLLGVLLLTGLALPCRAQDAKFTSAQSECKFLDAIQVSLEISTSVVDPRTARLTLNDNTISFNAFGDQMVSLKPLEPFTIRLTRLRTADPLKLGRRLYSIRFPDAKEEILGKNSLQLVWPLRPGDREGAARLILRDSTNRIVQTLDLERNLGTDEEADRARSPEATPVANYTAKWSKKKVTVTASGTNPTPGWENNLMRLPIEIYPPEFRFTQTAPTKMVPQHVTPFTTSIVTPAPTSVDYVFVTDANGRHRVAVEPDPHAIPDDAKAILEGAMEIELFSLEPIRPSQQPAEDFHGWKVLGKKIITDRPTCKEVVEAFEKGVREYKGGPARCFNPRHGIRVGFAGKTAEFVICFECFQVRTYIAGTRERTFLISRSPADLFNKLLQSGGVPLAKD